MSVAIILPARLASTRLPEKLLLDKTGKTVLEHTLERALAARELSKGLIRTVLVACDDEKLAAVARRAGVQAVLTSPDHTSGTDRSAEAAKALTEEVIVNVQADEPELEPALIVQVAALLTGGPGGAPMATLAVPIMDEAVFQKPNVVKVVVDAAGRALYFSRAPIPYCRDEASVQETWTWKKKDGGVERIFGLHHLGLYAYRREFLLAYAALPPSRLEKLEKLEQLRALEAGHTILVGLAPAHPPGIDTPEDYENFVRRQRLAAASGADPKGDFERYQSDWLDRGATFYGH